MPGKSDEIIAAPRLQWAAVVIVMAVCVALKLYLLHPIGPILFFDELLYKQDADSIAHLAAYASAQYPLGYPLVIAPALALGAGYQGVFMVNVLLTTLLVPACFLLAREVGLRHAWLAALAAALLPLQAVFPTQVLSENLFVPAFTFVAWYAVRGRCESTRAAALFGGALGGLFLIKYLALPAIPVLWATWLIGLCWTGARNIAWKRAAVASAGTIAALVVGWFAFVQLSGISVEKAGSKVTGIHSSAIGPGSIAMWACAYLAALCLLAGPFLPLFMGAVASMRRTSVTWLRTSALARLLVLAMLLTGACWFVATLHSAGGADNYPVPQRVVVRYFMLLTPLFVVLGLSLVLGRELPRPGRVTIAVTILLSIAAVIGAHAILYRDAVWDFPAWFATIPLYNSDIVAMSSAAMVVFVAVLMLGTASARLRVVWVGAYLVFLAFALHAVDHRAKQSSMTRPVHARTLAPLVLASIRNTGHAVVVTTLTREPPRVMTNALVFWGVPRSQLQVLTMAQIAASAIDPSTSVYLVTDRARAQPELRRYRFGSRTGYIYLMPARDVAQAASVPSTRQSPDGRLRLP